jgi:hypothetical protein
LNYDLRVSNDGKMAVKDTGNATPKGSNQFQELYLAPDVFNASQQALNNANSGVTLTQTATTIRGKPPGKLAKKTLHLITIQFADTPNNESYPGCNANAWNVIGTVRNAQPSATVETHGYFKSKINGSRWVASQQDDGAAYRALRTKITGQTQSEGQEAWQQLSDNARKSVAKKYGVNQYAKPRAAEAIGIFSAGTQGISGMGHWAGVLARSGGDYVTIENYAGNPGTSLHGRVAVNRNWYVRMFGARAGQSFYEFHKTHETADYGTEPIAVRFKPR